MLEYHEIENVIVSELIAETVVFSEVQDMLDLMGDAGANGCNRIIVNEKNLHPDFFKLHTGLAGEILQKFSTYNVKLAIVGDFSKYKSKSLQDFIRESNRGNRVFFVHSHDEATKKLCGIKTQ
jgi:hypothetical protein